MVLAVSDKVPTSEEYIPVMIGRWMMVFESWMVNDESMNGCKLMITALTNTSFQNEHGRPTATIYPLQSIIVCWKPVEPDDI